LKAGKGLPEKRAGSMACSAEAFFWLDLFTYYLFLIGVHEVAPLSFLVTFVSRQK
jgi:hypothetical protein